MFNRAEGDRAYPGAELQGKGVNPRLARTRWRTSRERGAGSRSSEKEAEENESGKVMLASFCQGSNLDI